MANKYLEITSAAPAIIPKGSVIKSISYDGSITVTSDCPGLLEGVPVEDLLCYEFTSVTDDDDNDTHPMDNSIFKNLIIDGVIYPLGNVGITAAGATFETVLSTVPGRAIKYVNYSRTLTGPDTFKRDQYTLRVKMIPSLASKVEIQGSGTGFPYDFYLKPTQVSC
jgi:hypothetical protein